MQASSDIHEVQSLVIKERQRRGVEATSFDRMSETGGEMHHGSEIGSFVERQLIPVHFGYGGWIELQDSQFCRDVLAYIKGTE